MSNIVSTSHIDKLDSDSFRNVLEFVGSPGVAGVSKRFCIEQAVVDNDTIATCEKKFFLRDFFIQNPEPSIKDLHTYMGHLRKYCGFFELDPKAPLLILVEKIESYIKSTNIVLDAIEAQSLRTWFPFARVSTPSEYPVMRINRDLRALREYSYAIRNHSSNRLIRIEMLDLSDKNLTYIHKDIFNTSCPINASNNEIKEVPFWFWKNRFRTVNLQGNPISLETDKNYHEKVRAEFKIHLIFSVAIALLSIFWGFPGVVSFALSVAPLVLHKLLDSVDLYLMQSNKDRFLSNKPLDRVWTAYLPGIDSLQRALGIGALASIYLDSSLGPSMALCLVSHFFTLISISLIALNNSGNRDDFSRTVESTQVALRALIIAGIYMRTPEFFVASLALEPIFAIATGSKKDPILDNFRYMSVISDIQFLANDPVACGSPGYFFLVGCLKSYYMLRRL